MNEHNHQILQARVAVTTYVKEPVLEPSRAALSVKPGIQNFACVKGHRGLQ